MIFTDKKEKEQIKLAFNVLLTQNSLTLRSWCLLHEKRFPYVRTYERLSRTKISEKEINEMIHTIDKKQSLQKINGKWVISRTL